MIRSRLGLIAAAFAAAVVLLAGRALSALIVDQGWYAALGASGVWREKVLAIVALKGGAWVLGSAFVFANLWAVRYAIHSIIMPTSVGNLELTEVIPARRLLPATLLASAVIGALLTLPLNDWTVLSMAWRGERFAEYEGYFQRDLGFYVYWFPLELALYTWVLTTIVVVTAMTTVLYGITRHLRLESRQLIAAPHVRRHLTALGSLVLMLLAWSYRLDAYELLQWGSGFDGLFNRVDHRFTSRVDLVLAVGTFAAALIVLRAGWLGQVRAAFVTVTLVLVSALLLRQVAPGVAANGAYFGAAGTRDRDYEATRSLFTRRAYNVEGMQFTESEGDRDRDSSANSGDVATTVTEGDRSILSAARDVVWWDAAVLEQVRGAADAPLTAVLPPVWQSAPDGAHAVLVTRTNTPTPLWDVRVVSGTTRDINGAPVLSRHPGLGAAALAEPLVAPGFTEHRIVSTPQSISFRMPAAQESETDERVTENPFADRTIAAANLDGFGARLAHAWATRDASLLSTALDTQPRAVVLHRDVRERVRRLTPVLAQGDAIAPVVYDGLLFWALDLYSASEFYPLTVRTFLAGEARSYFKHAATALVDAETGRVRFIAAGDQDPIARTALKRLGALIVRDTDLPIAMRDQLPIPTDGALAQAQAFTRVGSRRTGNTANFVPDSVPGVAPFPVAGTGLARATISWSIPLINQADQLTGVVEGTGGRTRETRWRPLAEPLARWSALTQQLGTELDTVASALRRESDGPVVLGTLRVLVRNGRPMLVRPAYTNDASGLHLTALAVATDSLVWAGANLGDILPNALPGFGLPDAGDRSRAEREAEARRLYDAMRAALRESDWLRFGATFDSLGRTLGRRP